MSMTLPSRAPITPPGTILYMHDNLRVERPGTRSYAINIPYARGIAMSLACCRFVGPERPLAWRLKWGGTWWTLVLTPAGVGWYETDVSEALLHSVRV